MNTVKYTTSTGDARARRTAREAARAKRAAKVGTHKPASDCMLFHRMHMASK